VGAIRDREVGPGARWIAMDKEGEQEKIMAGQIITRRSREVAQ